MTEAPAPDNEDIIRWPDGTWCHRSELHEYGWMSDDYETVTFGSPEWERMVADKAESTLLP